MVSCCVNCEQGTNRLSSQIKWDVKEKRVVKNDYKELGLKRKDTVASNGGRGERLGVERSLKVSSDWCLDWKVEFAMSIRCSHVMPGRRLDKMQLDLRREV